MSRPRVEMQWYRVRYRVPKYPDGAVRKIEIRAGNWSEGGLRREVTRALSIADGVPTQDVRVDDVTECAAPPPAPPSGLQWPPR